MHNPDKIIVQAQDFKVHIKNNLNPEQKLAVQYFASPLLIIAGAGSGKTMVITHKIAYAIENGLALPENILGITFTNKAAKEMKERVEKMLPTISTRPFISTFHAFCGYVLRHDIHHLGYTHQFVIYDSNDQKHVMNTIFKKLNINSDLISPNKVHNIISLLKNDLISPEHYYQTQSQYFYEPEVADIYKAYQTYLQENNAIDFDDMIAFTVKLFSLYPEVLGRYQEQFKYILIDEFQDTNTAQFTLIKLLAGRYQNLCVVGDFDQNIYSWRGANIQNILNFEKDYPTAETILLEQNYRSTQMILDAANGLIVHNLSRKDKRLWTQNPKGDPIYYYIAYNEREEAEFVATELRRICSDSQVNLSDCAILYRTNAQSRVFEDTLNRFKISYRLVGGLGFYSRKEIKDIVAYLRLVLNPSDNTAFVRIINQPTRGIGDTSCEKLLNLAQETKKSIFELASIQDLPVSKEQNKTIRAFFDMIRSWQALYQTTTDNRLSTLIKAVIEESGYRSSLERENTLNSLERVENILELETITQEEDTDLAEFLTQVSLISDLDQVKDTENAVTLMTLHNAKGLEFDIVFLVGMEEGLLPHYKTQFDQTAIEEERRLCYVGITRGKKSVYITSANQRSIFGEMWYNDISRFVAEIPSNTFRCFISEQLNSELNESALRKLNELGIHYSVRQTAVPSPFQSEYRSQYSASMNNKVLNVGDFVEHKVWGRGKVLKIEGTGENALVFISFNHDVKKLMLKYAPVTKV